MAEIVAKENIAPRIYEIKVRASEVAQTAQPGQFVVLRVTEKGERFPITIADFESDTGLITMIVQVAGDSTHRLVELTPGEEILDFLGPLGEPIMVDDFGEVACVAGGVGAALIFPVARALNSAGNDVFVFLGAQSSDYLILEGRLKSVSEQLIITTDDGSRGREGFGSDVLSQQLEEGKSYDRVFAAGPVPMMKAISEVTRPYDIKTIVSLNPIMVDGTGMCGGCRVTVGEETKFACMDGPEFEAHLVDFDELMNRQQYFDEEETCRLEEI